MKEEMEAVGREMIGRCTVLVTKLYPTILDNGIVHMTITGLAVAGEVT